MRKLRKYVVKKAFTNYLPEKSDFEIVKETIPDLKASEFLVKTEFISVDPYMRSFASNEVPYQQFGFQVGKVIESKNSQYAIDTYVVSHSGWQDFTILNGEPDNIFNVTPYEPDIQNLPISLSIGALGMPGITAYLGFLEICKPMEGEVVCVTSAAGAVGSLVGQIARIKGCTVIGVAGTDEKVRILLEELGFHHAFNYKTVGNIVQALKDITDGIDCYFDNVGGEIAASILGCMKEHGRVAACGSISTYGHQTSNLSQIKTKAHIKIEAFSFTQWSWTEQSHALKQLKEWLQSGAIKAKETVTNGFEALPDALIAMLKGHNVGKTVVKI